MLAAGGTRRIGLWSLAACWLLMPGCAQFSRPSYDDQVLLARQLTSQGMTAWEFGQWEQAEELFAKAIEACPVDERARARYAQVLARRGAISEAIEQMAEAVRLSGGDADLLVQLGRMHLGEAHLAEAERSARRAVAAHPQLASARALWGDVQSAQGRTEEALAAYHRALSLQPQFPEVQLRVARLYQKQGRPLQVLAALHTYAEPLAGEALPEEVLYLEGMAYKELGRFHEAATRLAELDRRQGGDAELLYQLADARWQAGDRVGAQLTVQEALRLEPGHAPSVRLSRQMQAAVPR